MCVAIPNPKAVLCEVEVGCDEIVESRNGEVDDPLLTGRLDRCHSLPDDVR